MTSDNLDSAILLSVTSHIGTIDENGEPFILHPIHIMMKMSSIEEKIVAILHDIVEDTSITLLTIEKQFGIVVRDAIDAISRRKGEDYNNYIKRVKENSLATKVKLVDLRHNMDILRTQDLQDYKLKRLKKYHKAYMYLSGQCQILEG